MSKVESLEYGSTTFSGGSSNKKRYAIIIGVIVGVCVVALVVGLSVGLTQNNGTTETTTLSPTTSVPVVQEDRRVDCYPEASSPQEGVDKARCEARGCVYSPSDATPSAPACYWPPDGADTGLKVLTQEDLLQGGKRWTLQVKQGSRLFSSQITTLNFTVRELSDNMLQFKFEDANDPGRYQVPVSLTMPDTPLQSTRYSYEVQTDPFQFKLTRTDTNTVIWDTSVGGFVFTDQFLQISTLLPTPNVYGFGENVHSSLRHDLNYKTWPLFSRDQPPGTDNENPLYSVHPFYECVEADGKTHGVVLMNSNAMEYGFTPAPMLTYRTIGGILDFYVMLGPSPENVIQQYTSLIGRPYMPPYWALGFQLSRYGYSGTDDMRATVNRTLFYNIPVDVQHADIDHMHAARDFTINETFFGDLPQYFTELQEGGMKTIIILDPAFEINDTYIPYVKGKAADIFVKWSSRDVMPAGDYEEYNSTDMMGYVWPDWKTVFPDFLDSRTEAVWTDLITEHRKELNFNGLWIDMNEPANFDTNNEKAWNWKHGEPFWTLKCPNSTWDDPPYRPKAVHIFDSNDKKVRMADKTICMQGIHANGTLRHYDVHSLYGHFQSKTTLNALRNALPPSKRGMVITRSSFPGTGQYAGRWLGDNNASWRDMRLSIIGILEFNLFGIPYIGADICGFFNDSPNELCKRWMQLGAFYTFSRNHNHQNPKHQDPGALGEDVAVASREALETRYRLLPYLYTLFHKAHTRGDTVLRPLFHEFPQDSAALTADTQFLWGPALLISPILEENQTSLDLYIPSGRWYDYYTGGVFSESAGTKSISVSSESQIPLHIRGGYIMPMQESANNTQFSRKTPFNLMVALDKVDGSAEGELFWDDGEAIDTFLNGKYFHAYFTAAENKLQMKMLHNYTEDVSDLRLDTIQILGVSAAEYVYINGINHTDFTFNSDSHVLSITNGNISLISEFLIEWSVQQAMTMSDQSDYGRLECCYDGCTSSVCASRGCIWAPSAADKVPWCFINSTSYGYQTEGSLSQTNIKEGNITLVRKNATSLFGGDIERIEVTITQHDKAIRIKITDPAAERFEVPVGSQLNFQSGDSGFSVSLQEDPFSFSIKRESDNVAVWDSSVGGLTFADQFLQLAARIHCQTMQGLGEHVHPHLHHDFNYRTWPLFTRDQPPGPDGNLYGAHPFYMCIEESAASHAVLLLNSNAMEVSTLPDPGIVFRTTGGILDLIIVNGESGDPTQTLSSYVSIIGKPFLPPYWSLGFHLSRYGYFTMDKLRTVVERNIDAKLPYDVQHLDIDTMDERKDFTIDTVNFKGLPEFAKEIRNKGIRTFTILDPFLVSNYSDYAPYTKGVEKDVYIKWPPGVNPDYDEFQTDVLLGWCWPKGRVVYPDFFHPNSSDFWQELIQDFYTNGMVFDGIWLDMNEPANFDTNKDRAFNWPEKDLPYWTLKCPTSTWDDPPYKPKSIWGDRLSDKTICMNTLQAEGRYKHYDVHNLYGWSQTEPTLLGVQKATSKRGMVVVRSTYPSSGRHAGHWLGDNNSDWPGLKDSIIGIIEFNMFGIPFVGADICGYFNNAPADLCQRWQQLGAFYPFSRNHQGKNTEDQDPAYYGGAMLASTKRVLETRYTLLPYLYTLFFKAHMTGTPVVLALSHVFNKDREAASIDRQFMWGPHLLISPVLEQNTDLIWAYFPTADNDTTKWYDYYTGEKLQGGRYHELVAPLDMLPLHVREDTILITQEPAVNTELSRRNPFGMIITSDVRSSYSFYWDDGESKDSIENQEYYEASCTTIDTTTVKCTVLRDHVSMEGGKLGQVTWYGLTSTPEGVIVNKNINHTGYKFYTKHQMLKITGLDINMRQDFEIEVVTKTQTVQGKCGLV